MSIKRCNRIGVLFFWVVLMIVCGGISVYAKGSAKCGINDQCVVLGVINIDEFMGDKYGNSREKLSQYATLDDVEKVTECGSLIGMKAVALVGGFDVVSSDNGGGGASANQKLAMLYNTWLLQQVINCGSENALREGKLAKIYLPKGAFYFVSGHGGSGKERYVIRLRGGVSLIGEGMGETILRLYSEWTEFNNTDGGLDMFFSDDRLINSHFSDFTVDGGQTKGRSYNGTGNGFVINEVDYGTWDNVGVENMDGSGIRIKCLVGGEGKENYVHGSSLKNNGKGKERGGSGVEVSTGCKENERFEIAKSSAEGNTAYGFTYEENVDATGQGEYLIRDSIAKNNTWNYGGKKSNNVRLEKDVSEIGNNTKRSVNFSDESRNVDFMLYGVGLEDTAFDDVESKEYYYDALLWAEARGLVSGGDSDQYRPDDEATRVEAVLAIWRMMGRPEVSSVGDSIYEDVASDSEYAMAIQWATQEGIVVGMGERDGRSIFDPNGYLTRAQFTAMLYRLNGSPQVEDVNDFGDVNNKEVWYYESVRWAVSNGITTGVGDNMFDPESNFKMGEVVAFLYRYWLKFGFEDCGDICIKQSDKILDFHHNEKRNSRVHMTSFGEMEYVSSMTLSKETPDFYKVIFVTNNNDDKNERIQYLRAGEKATEPTKGYYEKNNGNGLQLAKWYLENGEEYDFNRVVNGDMTLYALWVPVINYSYSKKGKSITINNPETINNENLLADVSDRVLYRDTIPDSEETEIWWAHLINVEKAYYGVRFFNPSKERDVELTINKCGARKGVGKNGDYSEVWTEYYSNGCGLKGEKISIPAGQSVGIFQRENDLVTISDLNDDANVGGGSYLEGVINVETDGELGVAALVFEDYKNYENTKNATYDGNYDERYSRQYSGYLNTAPITEVDISLEIHDQNKSGVLPVAYKDIVENDNTDGQLHMEDWYYTNHNGGQVTPGIWTVEVERVSVSDFARINFPTSCDKNGKCEEEVMMAYNGNKETGEKRNTTNGQTKITGWPYNNGDYAIHYGQGVHISNESRDEIIVTYNIIQNKIQGMMISGVDKLVGERCRSVGEELWWCRTMNGDTAFSNDLKIKVWSVKVGSGKATDKKIEFVLGQTSNGRVRHQFEFCRVGEAGCS